MKNILFIAFGLLLNASTVFARAGGGQDYVESSSGGSSSSMSFSGGGSLTSIIIFLIIVFVIRAVIKKYGKSSSIGTNSMPNGVMNNRVKTDLQRGNVKGALFNAAVGGASASIFAGLNSALSGGLGGTNNGDDINAEILKIKATDPGFNEQAFKDKAESAFFKVQEGWERQDVTVMRPYVSDSVLQRFTNQLTDLKSRGEKNVLENIVIGHMDINDVRSDTSFNYITVKIDASAADYTVDSGGQMIKGSKTPNGFTEYWTFLRTIGVKTDLNKQLKDSKCPNCGAALEVNATGKCNYCGAIVTSGQFDWVLSEIRQR